ncbi:MerR family transcriptional regulator [Acidaminobacter sp. JC074]|uniref:MerR family transcriptional regulator n=1 Tax=Acidaminobacter sp. JC074 TaxID=2530199 RepID=UPI001F10FB8C|nr:MerR family transcriptional regulator [Acidaminobacter sp. JC074]MCH4890174.1 MerR family transcriptional regulator [Acidaminobacter sp. JC074]
MKKDLITIGEMAKLHGISTQALRFYDKHDIFKPAYIDDVNGYRYYKREQFAELDMIIFLAKMNISLEEIKKIIQSRRVESMHILFEGFLSSVNKQLEELSLVKESLETQLSRIKKYDDFTFNTCRVVYESSRAVLYNKDQTSISKKESIKEYALGIKDILKQTKRMSPLFDEIFAIKLPFTHIFNKTYHLEDKIMLFGCEDFKEHKIIPSGHFASIVFKGDIIDGETFYHKLLKWIEENDFQIIGDGLYVSIIDDCYTIDSNEYISEIQIPIKKLN